MGLLGLNQEEKLVDAAGVAYKNALDRVLLPRLLARLETQIRGGMQRPEFLYEATRVYLMLGRLGPLDRSLVKEWMSLDWDQAFPGAVGVPMRDELSGHLQTLLAQDFIKYPLDGALVDQARRVFSRLPMPARVYARLRSVANITPPWRPADALGQAGRRWFSLASGKPLADAAIPGLYTVDGLHRGLLPRLPQAILEAASESWVLGPEAQSAMVSDPRQLETGVLRLYAEEYVRAWQVMLGDIVLSPFRTLPQAAEALNLLGAPNSPMRDLMLSVARQLSPGTPPPPQGARLAPPQQPQRVEPCRRRRLPRRPRSLQAAWPRRSARRSRIRPPSSDRSSRNASSSCAEISGQPLDGVLAVVNDLYVQVARLASGPPGTVMPAPASGLDPGQRIAAEAQRAPEPLSRWLGVIAQSTAALRAGGTRASIAAAAAQQLAPFCKQVETRFPFKRDPDAPDMPVDDFVRLFGPGGVFDQFFSQTIRNYVDTTQRPWRPVAADGLAPPVVPADILQFQRAAAIRDAFFPGQAGGGLRFELMPLGLSAGARGAVLDVEGAKTAIVPGAVGARLVQMQWPSRGPVSIAFDPPSSIGSQQFDGAWASMKFIARGRLAPSRTPDRMRFTIQQGEHAAEFELRASSIVHPFMLRELAEFRCPQLSP